MPISKTTKITIGLLSAGSISGVAIAYSYFSKDNFESVLGISVLNLTGSENSKFWTDRFAEFTATGEILDPSLNKENIKTWQNLQNWCNNNKRNKYNKDDQKFKNFESFCTWKIADKLSGHIPKETGSEQANWKTAHTSLKTKGVGKKLSKELTNVFNTEAGNNKDDQVAMHKWCTESYKATWKGNFEEVFKEVNEYCKA